MLLVAPLVLVLSKEGTQLRRRYVLCFPIEMVFFLLICREYAVGIEELLARKEWNLICRCVCVCVCVCE